MSDDLCGKWMPVSKVGCGLPRGHKATCRAPAAVAKWRERRPADRPYVSPEARARYRRTSKFIRYGLTEDQFNQMLEEQGYACGICRQPFGNKNVCIDHDHNCCKPKPSRESYSCGKCVRGLLCIRCNTWLGWMDKHNETCRAYLARYRPA